jgi:hypothetical protein
LRHPAFSTSLSADGVGHVIRDEIGRAGEPPRTRGALVVALVFALVAGCAALAFLFKTYVPTFDLPDQWQKTAIFVSATSLGAAFVTWIFLWLAVVRRRAPWRSFSYLVILILGVTAGEAGLTGLVVYDKRVELERAQDEASNLQGALADISTIILAADRGGRYYMPDRSGFPGEGAVIATVTNAYVHALGEDLGRESAKANRFFNAGNYYRQHRLGQMDVDYLRATMATARIAIEEFWKHRAANLAAYRSGLASAPLSAKTKAAALAAFDDAARRGQPDRASMEALDETMLRKSDVLVRAMQRVVTLEDRNSTIVDLYESENAFNTALREYNDALAARNRRAEFGMPS